jgi:hypothetical protein
VQIYPPLPFLFRGKDICPYLYAPQALLKILDLLQVIEPEWLLTSTLALLSKASKSKNTLMYLNC